MTVLKTITSWIRKRPWISLGGALVTATALLIPAIAGAEESDTATQVLRDFTSLISILLTFLNYLLYPMVMVAGALMDNEMLIGPAMEDKLLAIWVEIRNWVNMFFVLLLVGIAMYNVLGIAGDGSNYALKSILPKIVIGLVAVNFSFLAGKLLIDSTAVLTNAVYALPTSANLVDWDRQREEMRMRVCRIPKLDESGRPLELVDENGVGIDDNTYVRAKANSSVLGSIFCEVEEGGDKLTGNFTDFGQSFFSNFGQHNVAVTLMVQMGNVSTLNTPDAMGLQSLSEITFQMLFNIIIFVMFGFAYAALIVVLVARVIVLWIVLALSPVVILLFVLPDLSNFAGGEFDLKKKFFQHLFAPLIIGVVLSIGFTMLNTLQENGGGSWLGRIGEIDLGKLQDENSINQLASTYGTELSNFQSLLVAIGAVLVIWMGVFGAAKQTVASGIVETIKGAGEKFGKFMASTPLYATVIPVHKGGEGLSLGNIFGAAARIPGKLEQRRDERSDALANAALGIGNKPVDRKFKETREAIRNGGLEEGRAALHDQLRYKESWASPEELKKLAIQIAEKNPSGVGKDTAESIGKMSTDEFINNLKNGTLSGLLGPNYNGQTKREEWYQNNLEAGEASSAATAPAVAPTVTAAVTALKGGTGTLSSSTSAAVLAALNDDSVTTGAKVSALFTNVGGNEAGLTQSISILEGQTDDPSVQSAIMDELNATSDHKLDAAEFMAAVRKHARTAAPVAGGGAAPGAAAPGTGP